MEASGWIPLSVRYGNRRARLAWWIRQQRDRLALKLAPWRDLKTSGCTFCHTDPTTANPPRGRNLCECGKTWFGANL